MSRLSDLLNDDTNQFGPGTDLTISLLAVLLVIAMIATHMYDQEKKRGDGLVTVIGECEARVPPPCPKLVCPPPPPMPKAEGNFKPASDYFTAADFHSYPVTRLVDRRGTARRIERIAGEYRRLQYEYPYIFVIGHSNRLDDRHAADRSDAARRKRNLEYALRRAALIAGMLQEELDATELERLVAVSTGEADLQNAAEPLSQENAWVEVMFGKEWKPPSRRRAQ